MLAVTTQALCSVDGDRYVTAAAYGDAPAITFLWTTTFPLGFYAPSVIPLVIV